MKETGNDVMIRIPLSDTPGRYRFTHDDWLALKKVAADRGQSLRVMIVGELKKIVKMKIAC